MQIDQMPLVFKRLGIIACPFLIVIFWSNYLWSSLYDEHMNHASNVFFIYFASSCVTAFQIFVMGLFWLLLRWVMTGKGV